MIHDPDEGLAARLPLKPRPAEPSTRFANLALGLDAAFCNVVGLVFTLTGAFMAEWLGVAGWVATVFGVVVLIWSFVVTLFANRRLSRRRELDFVIKVNVAAIVASLVVLAIPGSMSGAGKAALGVGSAIVGGFVIAQFFARRSL